MSKIKFYKVNPPYGFFSKFSPHPIYIDGGMWLTVEHYFQASKFEDINLKEKIRAIKSPMNAALEGRNKHNKIRDDWEVVKEQFMFDALKAKFLQHPKMRKELLFTENSIIIEHTNNDNYWGDGGNGEGKNRLGTLLMQVRDEIKSYSEDPFLVLPPWVGFPTISQYDMFWRMGLGEEYLTQWSKYYLATDTIIYRNKFPETTNWEGIYD